MESAKNVVKDFLGKSGKHHTDVQTTTAAPVTDETVKRTNEERVTTAVDKEVHQDHHHTTVQPVLDSAVKDEQHHHNIVGTQERHIEHDEPSMVEEKLATERSQFQNTTRTVDGGSTTTSQPTVAGERVYHHVNETIQPVIQRETIEPHITHTTVPVHEVHHNATKHHDTSVMPPVGRAEFEKMTAGTSGTTTKTFDAEPELVAKKGSRRV